MKFQFALILFQCKCDIFLAQRAPLVSIELTQIGHDLMPAIDVVFEWLSVLRMEINHAQVFLAARRIRFTPGPQLAQDVRGLFGL